MELAIFLLIFTWLSLAIIAAIIGKSKGGDVIGWFFYGLIFGLIAVAHAIARHRTLEEEQNRHRRAGRVACVRCDEYISPKAVVCPYCGNVIVHPERVDNTHSHAGGSSAPDANFEKLPRLERNYRIEIIAGIVAVTVIIVLFAIFALLSR